MDAKIEWSNILQVDCQNIFEIDCQNICLEMSWGVTRDETIFVIGSDCSDDLPPGMCSGVLRLQNWNLQCSGSFLSGFLSPSGCQIIFLEGWLIATVNIFFPTQKARAWTAKRDHGFYNHKLNIGKMLVVFTRQPCSFPRAEKQVVCGHQKI